jgi:hypothetical protein
MQATKNQKGTGPMNTIQMPAGKNGTRLAQLVALLLGMFCATPAMAGLREPDVVIWGTIVLHQAAVTAANTEVVIEARRTLAGGAIASYQMGSNPAAGDFYSLRLVAESGLPLTDANAVITGDSIYLVVKNSAGDQDSKLVTVAGRGSITRVDFGSLDTNGNGILDDWETRYFGGLGIDPNADPDGDGASNLREFLEGTNPTLADARHPADRNAIDGRISINEVTSYGLAWRNNLSWPVGPVPIPISYVTKAGALWKGGELYKLDTNVAPTAPLWWTNVAIAGLAIDTKKVEKAAAIAPSQITRNISVSATGGFIVQLDVTPATNVSAFAVEEQIPAGYAAGDFSDGGSIASPQNTIRWGVFLDSTSRQLKYHLARTWATPTEAVKFSGLASFDGQDVTSGGILTLADPSGAITLGISGQAGAAGTVLTIRGIPGQSVSIETSANLSDWTPVKTAAIGALGSVEVPIGSEAGAEFFRARSGSAQ